MAHFNPPLVTTAPTCTSLPAVIGTSPKLIILGSMPGVASLRQQQYYAHPRNRFWPLIAKLLQVDLPEGYAARVRMLTRAGIALWDVLAECERSGSLDARIRPESCVVNDLPGLFQREPSIQHVAFNGGTAATLYARHLATACAHQQTLALPSTSPANAAYSLNRLAQHWIAVIQALRVGA